MPNLEYLSLSGESDRVVLAGPSEVWPILDKLSSLSMFGHFESIDESKTVVATLLPLCPSLRKLDLMIGHGNAMYSEAIAVTSVSEMLSVILKCSSLESLQVFIDTELAPDFDPHRLNSLLEGRLSKLEHLHLNTRVI
jgi:hypothetical protein